MRKDIHRPSQIDTSNYVYVSVIIPPEADVFCVGAEGVDAFNNHREKTGGKFSTHEHGGTCHVCGANAKYLVIFYHVDTNTYIHVGEGCADKFIDGDFNAVRVLREKNKNASLRSSRTYSTQELLSEHGLQRAWDIYLNEEGKESVHYEEYTIYDIVCNVVRFQDVSEKQKEYLKVLLDRIDNRAKKTTLPDIPTGRVDVEGTIQSIKTKDTRFGKQLKCVIKTKQGYTLYGSFAFGDKEVGDDVKFKATLKVSDNDKTFGFYSRPKEL